MRGAERAVFTKKLLNEQPFNLQEDTFICQQNYLDTRAKPTRCKIVVYPVSIPIGGNFILRKWWFKRFNFDATWSSRIYKRSMPPIWHKNLQIRAEFFSLLVAKPINWRRFTPSYFSIFLIKCLFRTIELHLLIWEVNGTIFAKQILTRFMSTFFYEVIN